MSHIFKKNDLNQLESRYRANLINSLSGYKSCNLVGSINKDKQERQVLNLTIY